MDNVPQPQPQPPLPILQSGSDLATTGVPRNAGSVLVWRLLLGIAKDCVNEFYQMRFCYYD